MAFTPVGFHNVDFPPPGGKPLAFAAPNGKTTTGILDEAGVPFWFNGLPEIAFAKELVQARTTARRSSRA